MLVFVTSAAHRYAIADVISQCPVAAPSNDMMGLQFTSRATEAAHITIARIYCLAPALVFVGVPLFVSIVSAARVVATLLRAVFYAKMAGLWRERRSAIVAGQLSPWAAEFCLQLRRTRPRATDLTATEAFLKLLATVAAYANFTSITSPTARVAGNKHSATVFTDALAVRPLWRYHNLIIPGYGVKCNIQRWVDATNATPVQV